MTETRERLPLSERRELLGDFRKQCGVTLTELGKLAHVSQPMLSQFENGARDLSAEAWDRVLGAMEKFLEANNAKQRERIAELEHERAKAEETAEKLGVTVALDLMGATLPGKQQGALEPERAELEKRAAKLGVTVPALRRMGLAGPGEHPPHPPEGSTRGIKAMLEDPSFREAIVKATQAAEEARARRKALLRKVNNTVPRRWLDRDVQELSTSYEREIDALKQQRQALKQQLQAVQTLIH